MDIGGGRALLSAPSRLLLSRFIKVDIPTGDEDCDVGEREVPLFAESEIEGMLLSGSLSSL